MRRLLLLGLLLAALVLPACDSGMATAPAAPAFRGPRVAAGPAGSPPRRTRDLHGEATRLSRIGRHAQARDVLRRIVERNPHDAPAWYDLAAAHCRLGQTYQGADCLARAVANGYRNADRIRNDPDIEALRGTRQYAAILKRLDVGPSPAPKP